VEEAAEEEGGWDMEEEESRLRIYSNCSVS